MVSNTICLDLPGTKRQRRSPPMVAPAEVTDRDRAIQANSARMTGSRSPRSIQSRSCPQSPSGLPRSSDQIVVAGLCIRFRRTALDHDPAATPIEGDWSCSLVLGSTSSERSRACIGGDGLPGTHHADRSCRRQLLGPDGALNARTIEYASTTALHAPRRRLGLVDPRRLQDSNTDARAVPSTVRIIGLV